ncbi:serine hydrolase [Sphaerobacter sp.]|uniref:serine hydrolase n=1 Tax=Sphaerobacter sp. TaxID=2099654 RepID=UPI001D7B2FD9|nr:serine hydrolase [Sphaerobacter sp.]MBX5444322.1 serine hydrolase [Sphaerobacter sp.]
MATDPKATVERIRDLAEGFTGTIAVAARDLDTGAEVMYNPDVVVPTASTMKTVLLYELYRQVDAGKIDPAMRITLEERHRVPGSGVLQDLDAGVAPTVKDIATLMITVSDNTATDMIYDLIGREAVAATIERLGMTNTHLPLDTWEILAGLHDLDPNDPTLTYDGLKQALASKPAPWDCAALRETPDNDVSTPRDMLRLLEAIHRGEGLSPASREAVIDILKRQKYTTIIPEQLPFGVQAAHKTGTVRGVRNDVGLVFAGERTYAVALMSKGSPNMVASQRLLSDVSRLIFECFIGPISEEAIQ